MPCRAIAQDAAAAQADPLHEIESRLAERYDRLELLAGRLAELTATTQPRRAELLRQLIARGRENDVSGQFDEIIAALADESFSTAIDGETRLQAELQQLLELLLQEDRDRQLESERKRVLRYLQDLNKLIRLQRGVKARTDGGDDAEELADDQERVGDETGRLQQEIEDSEATPQSADGNDSKSNPDSQSGGESQPPQSNEEQSDNEQEQGEQPEQGDADSQEPSGGEQSEGRQPSSGQPSEGQPQSGSPSGESQPQQSQQSPLGRAAERLKQAQERMKDAQKQLEQAQRDGAQSEQQAALEELEQAKADLEQILRQLREEEMERMLVLLEARFRKMLDEQVEVYEETKKLDKASASAPEHELEIAAGRQSRRERLIVREADRCLVLLREDGTSVAFPEAVEQARDDMQQIADRLNRVKVDLITQTMEEDVIAALEETLATLQQAIDDLRDQRAQQQGGGGGGGSGEQALVDQLAEMRMIYALQTRVLKRTEQYGALIEGEQALEEELLGLLEDLALRQAKITQATHDLDAGSNK